MAEKLPKFLQDDEQLHPFKDAIVGRLQHAADRERELTSNGKLSDFANAHEYYGLHKVGDTWVYRDWLPNATEVFLIGSFNDWQPRLEYRLMDIGYGKFETTLPESALKHGDYYKLHVRWNGGAGDRVPAYARRVVQDLASRTFSAQVWSPEKPFKFKHAMPPKKDSALVYEAHVGMATEQYGFGTYVEFRQNVLPRIAALGYDTIQLMAIQEHPYYGSFGYHVANFFAVSSRFGTPEELKELIDEAHGLGIRVIMDIVHSHAVKNENEGISKYDGSEYQFFHGGSRGNHPAWDSRCFDYGKNEVLHFLLSNCKFWIKEYNFDGFRFDGVTSMLFLDHGLGSAFTDYSQYFNGNQDDDAIVYLILANKLIHEIRKNAITIAEEMSGMPGLATPIKDGGYGFDFRLAMGTPDFWVHYLDKVKDEFWHVGDMFYRLTDKRADEKIISYAESHDQALVGDKTVMFRLADADMYWFMQSDRKNSVVERAVALHKMIRLVTMATAGNGYLTFMGNEFGHPEWIDFPREGNGWSHHYARRQWNLVDNQSLEYYYLNLFDVDMINLAREAKLHEEPKPTPIVQQNYDQVLVFKRGDYVFVFNFSPTQSFPDYGFEIEEGEYEVVINSDSWKYHGYDRIQQMNYSTMTEPFTKAVMLKLYIPNRVGFVLKKVK